MKQFLTLILCWAVFSVRLLAQDATPAMAKYLQENKDKWHLNAEEAAHGWVISDQYTTNQITHIYVQQTIYGLKLHNAVSTAAMKNGNVVVFNSRFTPNAAAMTNVRPGMQVLAEQEAVLRAAESVQLVVSNIKEAADRPAGSPERVFTSEGDAKKPIRVYAVYQKMADEIRLAWNVEIQANSDWWNIRVDAMTGVVLDKSNYTVYCDFGAEAYRKIQAAGCTTAAEFFKTVEAAPAWDAQASYRVFPFPGESPNHIAHQIINDPADPMASPYGWHDTNGASGAEFTTTNGNNVNASEDRDDNDTTGYAPDGGAALVFDFPYIPQQSPVVWQDAAITNLFYANNFMHDMTYHYGFTEEAGNYQENNYGRGGDGGDAVQADAQDGSGTNNANFNAPPDGIPGRMQMYLWTVASSDSITMVNASGIAGKFFAPRSGFGIAVSSPLTAQLVLVEDNTTPTSDGCDPILNAAALAGKIALLDRGNCNFIQKVKAAQDAGAIGAIVCNNVGGAPFSMGGNDATITIPSAMISLTDCGTFLAALAAGTVTVTFEPPLGDADHDSDVDNGIIAHEYGHGISIRMTGGPANSDCLNNEEQMGEGWSDWYALISTIEPGDDRFTLRPMGTYALGEPVTGAGIRNQVYTTDLSICTYTYDDLPATGGEPHNVGELWTAMLWDLSWDLIDQYGYDEDIFNGTSGNNIALNLVTNAMGLQACSPGFADGRDAILAADELLYGGANKCLIWSAFARRGLGFSADQGSTFDATDGTSGFDLPPVCLIAVVAPDAAFTVDKTSSCLGLATFQFTDQSQNIAHTWAWDFGDGTTSTETNPVHQYTTSGTFTVKLTVTNNIGADSIISTDLITVSAIQAPTAAPVTICAGQSATLTANLNNPNNTAEWKDGTGNIVFTGTTFQTPPLLATTTFLVNEAENAPVQHVGPAGPGTGGNHNTSFMAEVQFTAEKAFTIKSALVRAQGAGPREVRLLDGSGNVIQSIIADIPDGEGRIDLNIQVPSAGEYALAAGPNVNLYRDNAGVVYPFTIEGLLSITGSNAGQAGFYYYFYDWEVQETPCRSAGNPVTVTVTPGPVANFTTVLNGLVATFTNTSAGNPTSYAWTFGDGATSTLASPTHTYAVQDVYTVTLTVTNGSCTTVYTQVIDFTTATNSPASAPFDVLLSPNPAAGQTNLTLTGNPGGNKTQVSLYSIEGRLVKTGRYDLLQGNTLRLGLEGLMPGMYLVKTQAENGVVIRKLTVQ